MPPVNVRDEVAAASEVSWALVDYIRGCGRLVRAPVFERHHDVADRGESGEEFGARAGGEQGIRRIG